MFQKPRNVFYKPKCKVTPATDCVDDWKTENASYVNVIDIQTFFFRYLEWYNAKKSLCSVSEWQRSP